MTLTHVEFAGAREAVSERPPSVLPIGGVFLLGASDVVASQVALHLSSTLHDERRF